MKKLLLLICLVFLMPCLYGQMSNDIVTIEATVKNSSQEYVTLNYEPRFRGTLSFENYHTIGSEIDADGHFSVQSEKITDGGEYYLDFNKKIVRLVLFKGDRLIVEVDLDSLGESVFVQGNGAGKVNVLHLEQFHPKHADFELEPEQFVSKTDSIASGCLGLLDAIYKKETASEIIRNAPNREKIIRIITETPLAQKEYEFIKAMFLTQRFIVGEYITDKCEDVAMAGDTIDFSSPLFNVFKAENYMLIPSLNHYYFGNALEWLLKVEYMKYMLKENPGLTYREWGELVRNSDFSLWVYDFLKQHFSSDIHDKYYADFMAWIMTMGSVQEYYEGYLKKNGAKEKYLLRLGAFRELLEKGLKDPDYNLKSKHLTLDKKSFEALLEKHKGKNTLIVFWSAQFAGASVVHKIPAIQYLQKKYGLEVINICVDKAEYKNLWAARVIDNSWKGIHYFMPVDDNATTLNRFSAKKIDAFCYGGAGYAFISKQGIISNIDNPTELTEDKMADYLKN